MSPLLIYFLEIGTKTSQIELCTIHIKYLIIVVFSYIVRIHIGFQTRNSKQVLQKLFQFNIISFIMSVCVSVYRLKRTINTLT